HSDVDKIRQTLDKTDRNAFSAAVDAILNANNLYILCIRSAAALASFFGFYMNLMFDHVHLVSTNTSSEMFEQIIRVAPGDAVLGISFPRYSSSTVKALRFCHDSGATVIALTDSRQSPIAEMADHILVAESDMISLVDSLVAPMSLINALLVAIARKREEELQQTFEKLERIWDEYEVYEKVEL
ncbi:MAG: MurR/RpiR family transcriptional regulator, partial [Oscillospiraceae bacterium]|nr:MurR/RpiR family transcriptional regulator [Oscillospiraceae bacterium]